MFLLISLIGRDDHYGDTIPEGDVYIYTVFVYKYEEVPYTLRFHEIYTPQIEVSAGE